MIDHYGLLLISIRLIDLQIPCHSQDDPSDQAQELGEESENMYCNMFIL